MASGRPGRVAATERKLPLATGFIDLVELAAATILRQPSADNEGVVLLAIVAAAARD